MFFQEETYSFEFHRRTSIAVEPGFFELIARRHWMVSRVKAGVGNASRTMGVSALLIKMAQSDSAK
jgi:hypothetical protein